MCLLTLVHSYDIMSELETCHRGHRVPRREPIVLTNLAVKYVILCRVNRVVNGIFSTVSGGTWFMKIFHKISQLRTL